MFYFFQLPDNRSGSVHAPSPDEAKDRIFRETGFRGEDVQLATSPFQLPVAQNEQSEANRTDPYAKFRQAMADGMRVEYINAVGKWVVADGSWAFSPDRYRITATKTVPLDFMSKYYAFLDPDGSIDIESIQCFDREPNLFDMVGPVKVEQDMRKDCSIVEVGIHIIRDVHKPPLS